MFKNEFCKISISLFVLMFTFIATGIHPTPVHAAGIIYVNTNASGANNGSSWGDAYLTLQDALAAAASGDQIWVAAGVYYPDAGLGQTNNSRSSTFTLINGVQIYGGFAGTEALLSERNISANVTILSGDLEQNDTNADADFTAETTADIIGDNAYHVVRGGDATATTILDGFTITAGNADGVTFDTQNGGGLFNWNTNPTVQNVIFSGNNAEETNFGYGGGVYNYIVTSPAQFTNVTFTGNNAYAGGGMAGDPDIAITDSTFINNTASNIGGGLEISGNGGVLTNVTFTNNTAVGGGAINITSGNLTLTNVTFSNNTADSAGAVNVYQGNPEFINVTFDNNTATDFYGGAVQLTQSAPTFRNVTFSNNSATISGGGIFSSTSSDPTLANVTFTNNSAVNQGGGMYTGGGGDATLTNVTFSNNSANLNGGGLYALNGLITLQNTIITNSTNGGDCYAETATIDGAGHNLIESTGTGACGLTNGVNGNIIGSDPNLGSLTGSPAYFPLNAGSPAIDTGSNAICAAAPVSNQSQNGVSRPFGVTCDIGSFEANPTPLPTGWVGSVSVTSDKNLVSVGRPHIGAEVASYDGFASGSTTAFVPMLFKDAFGGDYDAALYIQNVSGSSASVSIEFYDNTGALNCTKADTIAPLASKGYWVPSVTCDTGSLPTGWVGGVKVTSNQNIVAVGRPHIGTEVMTYNGFSSGSTSAYIPMLFKGAFGGSYNAAYYIQNVSGSTASITLEYFDNTGTLNCTKTDTLASLASKGYWLPAATCDTGSLPAGWVGGVRVSSSQPVVTVGRPHIDSQITTYDGFSAGSPSSYVPMLFKGAFGGSYNAAFYVQNTHAINTANVTIKYYDNAGTLNCTKTDTIAPLASKGYWVPSATCDTGSLPAGWVGGVEVTSDQPIVSVGRPHIDAQVTTYNGFSSGAVNTYLPMLFKDAFGGSYDSAFYLQNTEASAATVTIQFYDSTGALTCSRSDTIQPRATLGFWVPSASCYP